MTDELSGCSRKLRKDALAEFRDCAHCGATFRLSPSRRNTQKYCSKTCMDIVQRQRSSVPRRVITCEECRQGFEATPDHGAWPRFCGRDCWTAAQAGQKAARLSAPRACTKCGASFTVKRTGSTKRFCSTDCAAATRPAPSEAATEARSRSMKAYWVSLDGGAREARGCKIRDSLERKRREDPEFARAETERGRLLMRRLQENPEIRRRTRDGAAGAMRELWRDPATRAAFTQQARDRYAAGKGFASPEAKLKTAARSKWIFKRAWRELMADTEYGDLYRDTQERLRREKPYDGPKEGSDYMEYLAKLGRAVVNDPPMRALFNRFMSEALPRLSDEWRLRSNQTQERAA